MKRYLISAVIAVAAAFQAHSQCTSIMVGKDASADGSVITSHNCDSDYRTWMRMTPAEDHAPGSMETIYSGRMRIAHGDVLEDALADRKSTRLNSSH